MRYLLLYIFSIFFLIIVSCNKEYYYEGNDALLRFSADTISFDTVFTSQGTTTQRLKVYNPYDKILNISNIRLAGSSNSSFVLNINGKQASSLDDVEIYPKDSLYIFIQVFINPAGENSPLLISDSIIFTLKQNVQHVQLIAYGQDVHLIKGDTLETTIWEADKPYLLLGDVTVDTLQTLTIAPGATIYFHKSVSLWVKGALIAQGDMEAPITFRGDRLDSGYDDIPGQWGEISLMPGSSGHQLDWCIIKNGTSGIYIGDYNTSSQPDLEISNSIIWNMSYNSLLAVNSKIKAINCVIADAALYACGLIGGGNYEFYHCTIANYYGTYASREISSVALKITNYYADTQNSSSNISNDLVKANFYNTIVYGNYTEEISIGSVETALLQYKFDHCLLKSKKYANSQDDSYFIENTWNENPEFKNHAALSFELDTLSPAKDKGDIPVGQAYPLDLKRIDRTLDDGPDIGAYERVENK